MRTLILVAGSPSHGPGEHEFPAGMRLLARCLEGVPGLTVDVLDDGRLPAHGSVDPAAVAIYADGGPSHPLLDKEGRSEIGRLAARGVGLGFMHYALEPPAGASPIARDILNWSGGRYDDGRACNPIWDASVGVVSDHPVANGVAAFRAIDEWYFNISFEEPPGEDRPDRAMRPRIRPILVATPSEEVRNGPYVWPAGPYQHIVDAAGRQEILMWTAERPDGGRSFGLTGGHYHANWGLDPYRTVVLNALAWVAGCNVPSGGIESRVDPAALDLAGSGPTAAAG